MWQLCAYTHAMNINAQWARLLRSGWKKKQSHRRRWNVRGKCRERAGFGNAAGAVTSEKCLLVAQQKQININWLEVHSHSAMCHSVYRQEEQQSEVLCASEKRLGNTVTCSLTIQQCFRIAPFTALIWKTWWSLLALTGDGNNEKLTVIEGATSLTMHSKMFTVKLTGNYYGL